MPATDFKVEVFESEVVVRHILQGHTYRFPILDKATIGARRVKIEPNGKAKRGARGYLIEARNLARAALEESR
jgi:hypothetical protein